jgi:hypothetical protein
MATATWRESCAGRCTACPARTLTTPDIVGFTTSGTPTMLSWDSTGRRPKRAGNRVRSRPPSPVDPGPGRPGRRAPPPPGTRHVPTAADIRAGTSGEPWPTGRHRNQPASAARAVGCRPDRSAAPPTVSPAGSGLPGVDRVGAALRCRSRVASRPVRPGGSTQPMRPDRHPQMAADRDVRVSLASVMGPPCCHEHGTTWGRG